MLIASYSMNSFSSDDIGNSCATATGLPNNSHIDSAIDLAGDVDYFKIVILKNSNLTVSATGTTDTYGSLKNAKCATIASNDNGANEAKNFSITKTVNAGTYYIAVRHYSSKKTGAYSVSTSVTDQSVASFIREADKKKACDLLYSKLNRPSLRDQTQKVASYVDPFTLPQTKTECTHTFVLVEAVYGRCDWHGFSCGWSSIPKKISDEIRACDTWESYKREMVCDVNFQMKLPNFTEKTLSSFVDQNFKIIESEKGQVASSLPIECADVNVQKAAKSNKSATKTLADAVTKQVESRIKIAVQEAVSDWIAKTEIKTILSTVDGGIGGVVMMATSVGDIIYSIHDALQPIIKVPNDTKTVAQNMAFSISCGDSGWQKI